MIPSSSSWPRLRDRWLLASLAVPLIVAPWGFDTAELPKLTFLRIGALGLMLTGLFTVSRSAWASSRESKISVIHPLRLPIMLLLIVLGAAALRSPDPLSSLAALVDFALLAFYAFSFTGAARSRDFQARALEVMVWVGAACAAWAVAQFYAHDPLNGSSVQRALGRPTGPFADPALLRGYLAAVFPLALWLYVRRSRERSGIYALTATLVIEVALLTSAPRLPLVAAGLGGIAAIGLLRGSSKIRIAPVIWALPALFLLQGLTTMRSPFIASLPELRQTALRMIEAHPLKGWGPGAFGIVAPHFTGSQSIAFHAPNVPPANGPGCEILSLGVEGGVLAILAFLWIVAGAGRILFQRLHRAESPEDSALAAAWAGLMIAWLVQSLGSPHSIALQATFWCALGLASASAAGGVDLSDSTPWPKPLRWAGVAVVAILLIPLPRPEPGSLKWKNLTPAALMESDLAPGPGAAVRWIVGDYYYGRAVRARDAGDWDESLTAHLAALKWAPSRIGNWLGFGDTAYEALLHTKHRPLDWIQYGQLAYYRVQKLEPPNGFAYFGEARLLTAAVQKGRKDVYPDASRDFKQAEVLYPALGVIPFEEGVLEESMGHINRAVDRFRAAAQLGAPAAAAHLKRLSARTALLPFRPKSVPHPRGGPTA